MREFPEGAVAVFGVGGVLGAEKTVEERERCGFPVIVRAVVAIFDVHKIVSVSGEILHGFHHFRGKSVQLLVVDALGRQRRRCKQRGDGNSGIRNDGRQRFFDLFKPARNEFNS